MLKSTILTGSLAFLLFAMAPAIAAEPVLAQQSQVAQVSETGFSEGQLDSFAEAYQAVQMIQQETQAELVSAVEAEGLTVEEFNEIAESQQSSEEEVDVSSEQAEQFSAAADSVMEISAAAREDMQAAIQAEGLTVDEFEQILSTARQDQELRNQIQQRLEQ